MNVQIIVDSGCDLTAEQIQALQVTVLPLKVLFGTKEYLDGVNLTPREMYEKLIESDEMPSTSQITPFEYEQAFKKALDKGHSVLCMTLSSQLSGSNQSAHIAAENLKGDIHILDTLNVSIGEQLLVLRAVELRNQGMSAGEITEVLEIEKRQVRVIALVDTLEYLKRGGRVSAVTAIAGGILNIKPVIAVEEGIVKILGKARGSRNGNNLLMELVKKEGGIDFGRPYGLAYSGLSDALLRKYIEDSSHLYSDHVQDLPICHIGSTIGVHTGPGTVAAAFFVQKR